MKSNAIIGKCSLLHTQQCALKDMEDLFKCFSRAKQWLDDKKPSLNLTEWTKVGSSLEREMASSGMALSCQIQTNIAFGSECGNMATSNSACWVLEVSLIRLGSELFITCDG